eukprot:COSAG02_NODE_7248_length_3097_cov_22.393596_3_plen_81_part_00
MILFNLFVWAIHDDNYYVCLTPTDYDDQGQPEYAFGCRFFQLIWVPASLYTLFVIVLSYHQKPYPKKTATSTSGVVDLER